MNSCDVKESFTRKLGSIYMCTLPFGHSYQPHPVLAMAPCSNVHAQSRPMQIKGGGNGLLGKQIELFKAAV